MLVASVPLGAKPRGYRNIVASGSNQSALHFLTGSIDILPPNLEL